MNSLDWIFLVIFVFAAFKGYRKGFILEIISLLALIIGVLGSLKLLDYGKEFISSHLEIDGDVLPYLSFLLLFIIIIILLNLIGRAIKKLIDLTLLGNVDDIAGSIMGILKWGLILSVCIWGASIIQLELPDRWTEGSLIYPYVAWFAPKLFNSMSALFPFLKDVMNYFSGVL